MPEEQWALCTLVLAGELRMGVIIQVWEQTEEVQGLHRVEDQGQVKDALLKEPDILLTEVEGVIRTEAV